MTGYRGRAALGAALVMSCCVAMASQPMASGPTPEQQAVFEACDALPDEQLFDCLESSGVPMPPQVQRLLAIAGDTALTTAMDAWSAELGAAVLARARALAAQGGARNLLAASLLAGWVHVDGPGDPAVRTDAAEWFARARRLHPADPLVAWMEATNCAGLADDCDAAAAVERLLRADGDNAAAQHLAVHMAHRDGDRLAVRTHLRLAAQAPRTDSYRQDLLHLLDEARRSVRLPPLTAEVAAAFGAVQRLGRPTIADDMLAAAVLAGWTAVAMPALAGVVEACSAPPPGTDAALRQDCNTVAQQLAADPSTLLGPIIGTSLLSQATAGQAQGDRWREQLRELYWLMERAPALLAQDGHSGTAEYFERLAADGEAGAWRHVLERRGVAVRPPADWLPANPRQRALVTTGRVPRPHQAHPHPHPM